MKFSSSFITVILLSFFLAFAGTSCSSDDNNSDFVDNPQDPQNPDPDDPDDPNDAQGSATAFIEVADTGEEINFNGGSSTSTMYHFDKFYLDEDMDQYLEDVGILYMELKDPTNNVIISMQVVPFNMESNPFELDFENFDELMVLFEVKLNGEDSNEMETYGVVASYTDEEGEVASSGMLDVTDLTGSKIKGNFEMKLHISSFVAGQTKELTVSNGVFDIPYTRIELNDNVNL